MRGGTQVRLTRKCNQIAIATPGRYRFILNGVLGIAYVHQFRASMTHEFLLESQTMSCCDEFHKTLPPSGPAGGDLMGEYPNPTVDPTKVAERISENSSAQKLLADALCEALIPCVEKKLPKPPTTLPPSGEASGDLQGNYPAPTIDPQKAVERIRLNAAALEALAKYLCEPMTPCIKAANPFDADKIAGIFKRCDGSPHIPNNTLPTCGEVDSKIAQAISSIPADKFLEIVGYDTKTHTLSFTLANDKKTYMVDLSDLLPVVVAKGLQGNGTALAPLTVQVKPNGGLQVDETGLAVSFTLPAIKTGNKTQIEVSDCHKTGIALGQDAKATGESALAMGIGAVSETDSAIALGKNAKVSTNSYKLNNGIAIGYGATVYSDGIAIGTGSVAYRGIAILGRIDQGEDGSIGSGAIAIGGTAIGQNAIAIGSQSSSVNSFAIGANAIAKNGGLALGEQTNSPVRGVALGPYCKNQGDLGNAIGYKSVVSDMAIQSVALGTYSAVTRANAVSFGYTRKDARLITVVNIPAELFRQVTCVAKGEYQHDAINGEQFNVLAKAINQLGQSVSGFKPIDLLPLEPQ
jgi:hypothetical protein